MQVSIYKIKKEIGFSKIKNHLISKELNEQKIKNKYKKNVFLYYQKYESSKKWKNFLIDAVEIGEDILKKINTERYILLIKEQDVFYVVLGGSGYFLIKDFIENDFAFKIASQLINKDKNIIKYSKEKSVMSKIVGQVKYFRTRSNFMENNNFGNFYKELNLSIDKSLLIDKFKFKSDEIKKNCACLIKNSFQINKSITFEKMLEIVFILNEMTKNNIINSINDVEIVENKKVVEELDKCLLEQLKNRCYENNYIDFDLCHEDFEEYLTADRYIVKNGKRVILDQDDLLDNIDVIFEKIKAEYEKDKFDNIINSINIETRNADDNILTKDKLIKHLHGDIKYQTNTYFFINGIWFLIENSFLESLDKNCIDFFKLNLGDKLNKIWKKGNDGNFSSEDDYNYSYIGEKNTLALHKIEYNNIELCDVLKWDSENNVYLYFVKRKVDNSFRDLCSQILISAKTVQRDKDFVKNIFNSLKKSSNSRLKNQSDDYSKIISKIKKAPRIYFVLSFLDEAKTRKKTIHEDVNVFKKFQSNIAKFSLLELILSMKEFNKFELKITQIKK